MTDDRKNIAVLQSLSQIVLDARLATLRTAADARAASLDRLADLGHSPVATELPELAAIDVAMRYHRWADQKRTEINLTLARQTATWLDARAEAKTAFGKAEALKGILHKLS